MKLRNENSPFVLILVVLAMLLLFIGQVRAATYTAYKTGERTTGMTKQCYYNALGNQYTITIKAIELCPLTIEVEV